MFYDGAYYMGGMHGYWWIFWLVVLGVIVFVGWGRGGSRHGRSRETPHEILRRRLASGELSTEEYERRKALLDRDAGGEA